MNSVKHFIIDRSKWRFGGSSTTRNKRFGHVAMLNEKEFMCCLGQCYKQMGYPDDELLNVNDPGDVERPDSDLIFSTGSKSTKFSNHCIGINDTSTMRKRTREQRLTKAFNEKGLTIEFINEYPK